MDTAEAKEYVMGLPVEYVVVWIGPPIPHPFTVYWDGTGWTRHVEKAKTYRRPEAVGPFTCHEIQFIPRIRRRSNFTTEEVAFVPRIKPWPWTLTQKNS